MSNGRPAPELTRITTRYVAAEDRLRLAGERADGSPVAIWLTQRMLQRLVPKLLAPNLLVPTDAAQGTLPPHRELFLGFAQQKALATQVPVVPVAPPADAESWLAERATISCSPQALTVSFQSADGKAASLFLAPVAVHRWLAIIYRAYRSAHWPMEIWPAWLSENLEPAPAQPQALH